MLNNKVYFFSGCLANFFNPNVTRSSIKILELLGFEIIYPTEQTCCGQIAFNRGNHKTTKKLLKYFLKIFLKDIPIIVPSYSCFKMLTESTELLALNSEEESMFYKIKNNIYEWSYFLIHKTNCNFFSKDDYIKVAYHCCDHKNIFKISEPYQILSKLKNVDFEVEKKTKNCGSNEALFTEYPEITNFLAKKTINNIINQDVSCLLGIDTLCLLHLDTTLRKLNINLPVVHLAEFVWSRIIK